MQQFGLTVKVLGGQSDPAGTIHLEEGKFVEIDLHADRDCYIGVWYVDAQGQAVQLFPNRFETDHLLRRNQTRRIPGDPKYGIQATPSTGPEYLHIFASTQPWTPVPSTLRGGPDNAYDLFSTTPDLPSLPPDLRALVLVPKTTTSDPISPLPTSIPSLSETILPLRVEAPKN